MHVNKMGTSYQYFPATGTNSRMKSGHYVRRRTRAALSKLHGVIAGALFYALWSVLRFFPTVTLAKLRHSLRPTVRLDYARHKIELCADSDMSLYRARACRKEPHTIRWIEDNVEPDDVFYDVGANVGAYSLVAAKHGRGRISIHAFEPSFSTYSELCRNVILNACEGVVFPHLLCLAEAPGQVIFNYGSVDAGSALHTVVGKGESNAKQNSAYQQPMIALSIDSLIAEFGFPIPQHIKLDVDGTELAILRGASETLDHASVRTLQVEVNVSAPETDAIVRFLEQKGFKLTGVAGLGGGMDYANYVFARSVGGVDSVGESSYIKGAV